MRFKMQKIVLFLLIFMVGSTIKVYLFKEPKDRMEVIEVV